jgi:hypothetical protein
VDKNTILRLNELAQKKGCSMSRQIGLWIDHKKALILTISDRDECIQTIESGIEKHIHYRGATHPHTPYSPQYQQGEDQLDKKFTQYLNNFYFKVIGLIQDADCPLMFGPGEAKYELKKLLADENVRVQRIRIETADKMTDRQITAKVRKYYQEPNAVI